MASAMAAPAPAPAPAPTKPGATERTYVYKYPFRTVAIAQWSKYPNPWSPHVLSIDSFHRSIDARGTLIKCECWSAATSRAHCA